MPHPSLLQRAGQPLARVPHPSVLEGAGFDFHCEPLANHCSGRFPKQVPSDPSRFLKGAGSPIHPHTLSQTEVSENLSANPSGIATCVDKAPSVKENEKASQQRVDATDHRNPHTNMCPNGGTGRRARFRF